MNSGGGIVEKGSRGRMKSTALPYPHGRHNPSILKVVATYIPFLAERRCYCAQLGSKI